MILIAMIAGVALTAGLATETPTVSAPPAGGPLSFDGATLGMTVGAWRSLAPPPGVGPSAAPDCGPAVGDPIRAEQLAPSAPAPGNVTCSYGARFGAEVLLHSAKFDDRFRLDGLRYRFAGGRLSEIDFTTSIDAYNDVVARLTAEYGAPVTIVRDVARTATVRLPRVRQVWRTAGGSVSLTDPSSDPLRLSVRFADAPGPGRLTH